MWTEDAGDITFSGPGLPAIWQGKMPLTVKELKRVKYQEKNRTIFKKLKVWEIRKVKKG